MEEIPIDPRKVGRDSGEDKGKRFAAALELARKLKELELKRLKKQGLSGEELKRKLGSTSELADYLYAVHPKEIDKYIAEKKRQLEEFAGRKKKSSTASDIPSRILGALESGFRKLLQKKEENLERNKPERESGPKREGEKKDSPTKKKSSERKRTERDDKPKNREKERADPKGFSEAVKKSRKISESRKEFSKEVQRLHFEEGLSQQEVADKLGVNVHTIYRLFKKEDLTPRASTKKINLDQREVKQLYDSGLTQKEVAEQLGVSESTIYRHFKKHDIKPHRIGTRDEVDSKEVHRLHFEERLNRKEVAEKLGVSEQTISRIFRDKEWITNRVTRSRVYIDESYRLQPIENLTKKEDVERHDDHEEPIRHHFQKQNQEEKRSKVDIDEIHRLYFNEKLTQKEVAKIVGVSTQTVSRIFRNQNWEARRAKDEIYQLHFIENLTQREIAERLDVQEKTILDHFRQQNWEARQEPVDIDEIYRLYYKEHLTQREIAERLDVRVRTIRHHFREQNWKTRKRCTDLGKYSQVNMDEVRRLYVEEKLNQSEVAKVLGIPKYIVSEIFKENNWKYRDYQVHSTDEIRKLARKENRKKTQLKVVEMREKLFGKKCQICTEERKIAIHRKDGAEHDPDDLWKVKHLRTVNPDEYAAVCIPCHRGVHWMMSEYGQNWNQIRSHAVMKIQSEPTMRKPLDLPNETVPSSQAYLDLKDGFEGSEEELRRALLGEKCYFCDLHYNKGKRVIIHRKDGRPHDSKLTTKEQYFRTLEPKEWVSVCQKHHRYVHWVMDDLGLEWDDLKRKEGGAEGEI